MITKDDISLDGLDIIFEITRFCNMACPHCVRGESQRIRIKKDYINSTLQQLENIGTMMFTGGEPALAVDLMDYTYDACLHYNVEVQNFWMATNGSITSKKFFDIIERWINYCSDNEISGLRVSFDQYHEEVYSRYEFEEFVEYRGLQLALEFQGAPNDTSRLIGDGRALDNYYTTRMVEHGIHLQADGRIEGSLYINAKGFVLSTCDISYNTSDEKDSEFVICRCTDDIQEKLADFFNAHPELIYKD
jgi:organic radical activating enzyme